MLLVDLTTETGANGDSVNYCINDCSV